MADQDHLVGGGGSGGQGDSGGDRPNKDPAVPPQADSGDQESGGGYGNNAGVQGEEIGTTAEGQPS
jgi:hypothetical protein